MSSPEPYPSLSDEDKRVLERIAIESEVEPTIGLESGVHYPPLEDLPGWMKIIERLCAAGLVEKQLYDRVIKCPRCESIHVASKYSCPRCNSFNVERTRIIHHPVCGYTDTELKFFKEAGALKCPHCGMLLRDEGVDYIVIGSVYECLECGRKMDQPDIVHVCLNCKKSFSFKDAVYDAVYKYRITKYGYNIYVENILKAETIPKILKELGLRVEVNVKVKGLSGVEHSVDIAAWRNGDLICTVDFSRMPEDLRGEVLNEVVKYLDLRPRVLVLIAPKATEDIVFMARSQNINIITMSEVHEELPKLISSVL